jgi:DNA-binding MarR family transcriptional regulator
VHATTVAASSTGLRTVVAHSLPVLTDADFRRRRLTKSDVLHRSHASGRAIQFAHEHSAIGSRTNDHAHDMPRAASPSPSIAKRPSEAAFIAFWGAASRLRRLAEVRYAQWNLSPAQWRVLHALHQHALRGDRSVRATDLCNELLLTKATMSGLLNRLVRMRLLRRARMAVDQRAASVTLSATGRALVSTVLSDHRDWIASVMAGLTAAQQRSLTQTLSVLTHSLDPAVQAAAVLPPTGSSRRTRRSTRKPTP